MKMEDIARLANVSKSAVSLALNNKPGISQKTREHILKVIDEYNYIPLRKSNTKHVKKKVIRFVACISKEIVTSDYETMPFFNELISNLMDDIEQYNCSFILSTLHVSTIEDELISLEAEQPSDGIILLATNLEATLIQKVASHHTHIVVLDTFTPQHNLDFVLINNFQGGYMAAQHLIDYGHRSIGYAMSNKRIYNFEERHHGFSVALSEHDLLVKKENILHFPPMLIASQEEKFADLQHKKNLPTAFFCETDYIAISLIKTLNKLGIRVPEDVSVIGFDDIQEARIVTPELTTIHVHKQAIASQALRQLIQQIDKHMAIPIVSFVNSALIVRGSTAVRHK